MFHHLMPSVVGACFSNQIILLDTLRDRYAVLSLPQSAAIAAHLGLALPNAATDKVQTTPILKQLIEIGWLTDTTFPAIDPKFNTLSPAPQMGGMSANGWKLPNDAFAKRPPFSLIFNALFILRVVHKCAVREKLPGLLQLCTQAHQTANLTVGQPDEYATFVRALNWACLLYPKSTKCLEWSVALTLLCARAGLALKLVIGVQSFPFYAHAWSEANGVVIGDSPSRREELSVILEFPSNLLELPYDSTRHRSSWLARWFGTKSTLASHSQ